MWDELAQIIIFTTDNTVVTTVPTTIPWDFLEMEARTESKH